MDERPNSGTVVTSTSSSCHQILETIFLGGDLDAGQIAHVKACTRCGRDAAIMAELYQTFAAHAAPAPPLDLTTRVLRAAAPLTATLGHHTVRAYRRPGTD